MKIILLAAFGAFSACCQPYTISTISGIDRSENGLQATFDRFGYIVGVAADPAGNLYFNDWPGRRVHRIEPGGKLSLVAGSGDPINYLAPPGTLATNVAINDPEGVAVDAMGNVYILQPTFHQILKVSTDGFITTFAGTSPGSAADGIPATSASLVGTDAIAADSSGNVFLDEGPRIRRIGKDGIITTVAGTGLTDGPAVLSGPGTKVNIGYIAQMAADAAGNLYFADKSFRLVRKLSPNGLLTTVAGTPAGAAEPPSGPVPATSVVLSPVAVAVDGTSLYIGSESYSAPTWYNYLYRVSLSTGILELIGGGPAGTSGDGGAASSARFSNLAGGVAAGPGVVYVVEPNNPARIRVIKDGIITNFAGRDLVDGEPASGAPLIAPGSIATDLTGNIWFTEEFGSLWRIGPDALIHAVNGVPPYPRAAVRGNGNLYFSTTTDQIFKISPTGAPVLIGGNGQGGHSGDNGPALQATFDTPNALAVDSAGNVYVAEEGSSSDDVRMIAASNGIVNTIAGNHTFQYLGDNSPPLSTGMTPCALALDDQQNLYIGDDYNSRVLVLTPGGQLTTFAGGGAAKPGDGGPATSANLGGPCGLAWDSSQISTSPMSSRISCAKLILRESSQPLPAMGSITRALATEARRPKPSYFPEISRRAHSE
jgi:hypothetical protein